MTLMWDLCGVNLPEIGAIFRAGITQQLRRMQGPGKGETSGRVID
jgi:hypothetical protein